MVVSRSCGASLSTGSMEHDIRVHDGRVGSGRPSARRDFGAKLWRLGDLTRATESRSFRAKAYRNAVWALDNVSPDLDQEDAALLAVPGVGPGIVSLIREFCREGTIERLEVLESELPVETPVLRRLPRMNPRILREMKALGIESRADLRIAIQSDLAASLPGVGPATETVWQRTLALPPSDRVVPAFEGWSLAGALARHVANHTGGWVDVSGAVRRMEEWVADIELVVSRVTLDDLVSFLETTAVLAGTSHDGSMVAGFTHTGLPVRAHWAPAEAAGTALLRVTGPPHHVISLDLVEAATEHRAYEAVGNSFVPAPARHLPIDVARNVVPAESLRGDLHIHSEASPDGRMPLELIFERARSQGYEYVLITDHTSGLRFGGLDTAGLMRQTAAINGLRAAFEGLSILQGAEVNIGPEGALDVDDDTLGMLDFVVAGLHSHFGLSLERQTERLVTAIGHTAVGVLAHPFGRRIGIRPPIEVDMVRVIDSATEFRVALEVNGHRDRLDLPADWIPDAARRGAMFAANSDAHRVGELDNIANAIGVLQKAGVGAEQVVNTWPLRRLLDWRAGASP